MNFKTWAVALALSAGQALPAAAETIVSPDWVRRPTATQLLQVLPRGLARGVSGGQAVIACDVTVQGALRGCKVLSEDPPGMGFGAAALLLTPHFQMRPPTKDGKPAEGGVVRIPIRWKGDFSDMVPSDDAPVGTLFRPEPNRSRVIGRLRWREAPSVADVAAAYPAKARDAKAGGRVVLNCVLKGDGGLSACRHVLETPTGYGFAGAARALAPKFVGPVTGSDGQALEGMHTQLTFTFDPQSLDAATPVVGKPDWAALPGAADFAEAFPMKAREAGVQKARVVLLCSVGPGGALGGCTAQSEEPAGYGFGAATMPLADNFRVNVWTEEGLPVIGGSIRVPLRYDLSQDPTTP